MSRSLFEEAISDAKQLREVAEQNAKSAILEAVTPKIKQFIESQLIGDSLRQEGGDSHDFVMSALSESADDEDEDVLISPKKHAADVKHVKEADVDEEEEVELNETALASLVDLFTRKNNKKTQVEEIKEVFDNLAPSEQIALLEMLKDDEQDDEEKIKESEINKASKTGQVSQQKGTSGDKKMATNRNKIYELDLDGLNEDKIVIDLGTDIELDRENPAGSYSFSIMPSDEEEGDVEVLEEPPEDGEEEEPLEDEEGAPEDEEGAGEEEEGAVESAVYEIDENMLRRELVRLREAKAAKGKKAKAKSHMQVAADSFGGGELYEMDKVVLNKLDKLKEAYTKEVRKNRDLQQQLKEYENGIETLREQLSDLNLFNAKLLYVNKLIQNSEVSPSQRRAVVEALDGAKNLREAKVLYKSLSESLTRSNPASLNESARRLSPGQASRPTTSGSTRLNESTEVDRWATLAGIK